MSRIFLYYRMQMMIFMFTVMDAVSHILLHTIASLPHLHTLLHTITSPKYCFTSPSFSPISPPKDYGFGHENMEAEYKACEIGEESKDVKTIFWS